MGERADVGDLVSIQRNIWPSGEASTTTALVVAEDDGDSAEGHGWVRCRWSPVDATWLPREKVVVISKAYKRK